MIQSSSTLECFKITTDPSSNHPRSRREPDFPAVARGSRRTTRFTRSEVISTFFQTGFSRRTTGFTANVRLGQLRSKVREALNLITEAVRQIRGTAVNQVQDAEVVSMSSGTNVCILGRDRG